MSNYFGVNKGGNGVQIPLFVLTNIDISKCLFTKV